MKLVSILSLAIILIVSCSEKKVDTRALSAELNVPQIIKEFGFVLNDFEVVKDTVKNGESFGQIMQENAIGNGELYEIVEKIKDTFDVRKIRAGKPYTILKSKEDTLSKAKVFIYQNSKVDYTVVDLRDSIITYKEKLPVKRVLKEASGEILTNLSMAMEAQGLDMILAYEMADVYAWNIDFTRLQKHDKFKVIYEEKYINDSIYAGIGELKAVYFEHGQKPFYAFRFETDSIKQTYDYYDEQANSLRRQFLKAPVEYKRISSRYNPRRFLKLYGRIKPHLGTDFAAAKGTPIVATADGKVTQSTYNRGAGNFVTVRHNSTYTTKYFHMSKRKSKVGDVVKQGDVIGYVGSTGYSTGPHVCYRFWKNGKQVDPFKEKLPAAEPIRAEIKDKYLAFIQPWKEQLDAIRYPESMIVEPEDIEAEPVAISHD